jgi:GMP synthase (glutamine-hydrolysing)
MRDSTLQPHNAGDPARLGEKEKMHILVLRHVDCEPPAAYLPLLQARGEVRTVRLGVDPLPDHCDFSAVVAMGGPMGAGDSDKLPWIAEEIAYIAGAVEAGVPYWGVCLGAQLLAAALGAKVYAGDLPEVGIAEVRLMPSAATDPVFAALPERFPALQWHSDTFDLPPGAALLASSDAYVNQAFAVGSAYGLQFHLETPPHLAAEWLELPAYRESLTIALGPDGPRILLDGVRKHSAQLLASAREVMRSWLDTFVAA